MILLGSAGLVSSNAREMSAAVVVYRRCLRYEFCICFMPLVISTSRCLNITESQVLKTFFETVVKSILLCTKPVNLPNISDKP